MTPTPTPTPRSTKTSNHSSEKWQSAAVPDMQTAPSSGAMVDTYEGEHSGPGGPIPLKKVRQEDIIYFCSQLAVMVDTGVPLADALDAISQETEHTGLRAMVADLSDQVKGGAEFSKALESHPRHFSRLFVALMRASEASGQMGSMLQRVSVYLVQERDIRRKVKGAMAYPLAMLGFCVLVVVCLMVFVLPQFREIYEGKGAVLPAPTKLLLGISDGLISYWPMVIGGTIAAIVGATVYFRSPGGQQVLDYLRINLPIVGPMYRRSYLSRSLRTMSTMVATGVGVLDGLDITAQVAGNHYYARIWKDVSEFAEQGKTLADGLREHPLIPAAVAQMVSAGERTGRLELVLERVAGFCEDEMEQAIKTMTSFIEPVMIIVIGGVIGAIAIALLMPIFSVSKVMAG